MSNWIMAIIGWAIGMAVIVGIGGVIHFITRTVETWHEVDRLKKALDERGTS